MSKKYMFVSEYAYMSTSKNGTCIARGLNLISKLQTSHPCNITWGSIILCPNKPRCTPMIHKIYVDNHIANNQTKTVNVALK